MIVDLFAGPGGWDEGLSILGRDDVLGVELDKDACATAEAAGHKRLRADVTKLDTRFYSDVEGIIASPPCQTFSAAGKSEGVASLDDLAEALDHVSRGDDCDEACERVGMDANDPRSVLVLEPLRFIRDLNPVWVACEEVPPVLPVWIEYARLLERMGYSTWAGILNAADYGVPQKRKRAFLLASRRSLVAPPKPTHVEGGEWSLFDQRSVWVTMADALGWTAEECRKHNLLAPTPAHDPIRALWPLRRPATTIVRSFRPDVVAAPGYRQAGDGPRQNQRGSLAITPEQMCILQGIRTDYPFQGNAGKQLSLIGAILPPPWAAAILQPLLNYGQVCAECGNDDATQDQRFCMDCLEVVA